MREEKTLFGVRATYRDSGIGRTSTIVNVLSTNKHDALDKVKESDEYELYDEPIQRSIVDGEINEHRVERKYSDYIYEQKLLE